MHTESVIGIVSNHVSLLLTIILYTPTVLAEILILSIFIMFMHSIILYICESAISANLTNYENMTMILLCMLGLSIFSIGMLSKIANLDSLTICFISILHIFNVANIVGILLPVVRSQTHGY